MGLNITAGSIDPRGPLRSVSVRVIHGDCRAVMGSMDEASVDAIVCDPPYLLEFMGKEFDRQHHHMEGASTGEKMQAWHLSWAREAYRVLRPGAHLLAFGGSRTYHRLASAIEDAGFEVRDQIMWLYGCLSEDTEILIDGQWEHYTKAISGRLALCYDASCDEFSWQPIKEQVVYDYDETAFQIRSERTDQIVSRNHRCIIDRGNGWEFVLAEEAAREHQICVPIVEDLPDLLAHLQGHNTRATCPEQDVFASMQGESDLGRQNRQDHTDGEAEGPRDPVRGLRGGRLEAERLASNCTDADVFSRVQREASSKGACAAFAQGALRLDWRLDEIVSRQDDGRGQSSVERGSHLLSEAWELQVDQVRSVSAGVHGDGATRRLRDGTSANRCEGTWQSVVANGGGSSREPRSAGQSAGEPGTVCFEQGTQAARGERFAVADLARIKAVPYRGIVWCVKVSTGAFVVRRNGKVFVTGNSGFPKSRDVSKAIDAEAGAEREVVGERHYAGGHVQRSKSPRFNGQDYAGGGVYVEPPQRMNTAPATDLARQWAGWGTALKPANEPLIWAQKKFSVVPDCATLVEFSATVEALLWSMSPAKLAAALSGSNRQEQDEASGSVRLLAALLDTLSLRGASAMTDMFNSPETGSTFLSTALLWNAILAASWPSMSTSTIGTASSLTTGLRTLSCLASAIIPESTIKAALAANGVWLNAEGADSNLSASPSSSKAIPARSVRASASTDTMRAMLDALARLAVESSTLPLATVESFVRQPVQIASQTPDASNERHAPALSVAGLLRLSPLDLRNIVDETAWPQPTESAISPNHEPLVLARKPLGASTVAANVLEHGTGGLNIDGCRVPAESGDKGEWPVTSRTERRGSMAGPLSAVQTDHSSGRWPANVIHDGSDEVEAAFAAQSKVTKSSGGKGEASRKSALNGLVYQGGYSGSTLWQNAGGLGDTGTASRFFYCAKAGRSERWKHVVCRCSAQVIPPGHVLYKLKHCPVCGDEFGVTAHPTQKPENLMRFLCRLITPPGGTVLDMFAGSGSTGCAALAEGFGFVGIEADAIYAAIAEARIAAARVGPKDRPKPRAKAEVQPSPTPDLFSLAAE
jgi:DNA modification methylase